MGATAATAGEEVQHLTIGYLTWANVEPEKTISTFSSNVFLTPGRAQYTVFKKFQNQKDRV
jgi:hypothetical protein